MRKTAVQRSLRLVAVFLLMLIAVRTESPAEASCGSASCFVVIGSQQQVSPAGVFTVNLSYTYTPNEIPPTGASTIPFSNQQTKQLILANSNVTQLSTLVRIATLDVNYGLTERIGLALLVPYRYVTAIGQVGAGAVASSDDRGIGDVMGKFKYNLLPTLRSMVVLEMGVYFPTGDYGHEGAPGQLLESSLQVGKGAFGFQPGFYQTYEVLPHRLNQFLSGHWRYNLRNSDGYRTGQEYALNTGLNLVTLPWLTFTTQFNFRYKTMDNIEAALFEFQGAPLNRAVLLDGNILNRPIPTTNSTYLAFSAGVVVNVFDYGQLYAIAQLPIYRDFNGNLQQDTGYVFGMTKSFATTPLF
ncbi:MAG: transporter [Nitrospira sp. CG24C]|nr:MAG: transporter [Nitrospira sp. CG24C]